MAKRLNLPDHSIALVFHFGENDNILGSMAANLDDTDDDGKLYTLGTGIMHEVSKNMSEYVEAGLQQLRKTNSRLDRYLTERDNTKALLADVKGNA
jgi:predicted porin